jgi:hypothetical protein
MLPWSADSLWETKNEKVYHKTAKTNQNLTPVGYNRAEGVV